LYRDDSSASSSVFFSCFTIQLATGASSPWLRTAMIFG
jgi:hypothetical protein